MEASNLLSGLVGSLIGALIASAAYWHSSIMRSRKALRDSLFDLQDKIVHPPKDSHSIDYFSIFKEAYPQIRKQAHELAIWDIQRKREIMKALKKFAGNHLTERSVEKSKDGKFRDLYPVFKGKLYSFHLPPTSNEEAMKKIQLLLELCD